MNELFSELIAGFAGAFFAFLFMRMADLLTRFYDRQARHHRALIRLDYAVNQLIDGINNNIYEMRQILVAFEAAQQTGRIFVVANRPFALKPDLDFLDDLFNVDLINEAFSLQSRLNRYNSDVAALNAMYELFRDAFIADPNHRDNYLRNMGIYVAKLRQLIPHLGEIETRVRKTGAAARVLERKDRPMFNRVIRLLVPLRYQRDFESKRTKELVHMDSEIKEVKERSRKKIEEIERQSNNGSDRVGDPRGG